MSLITDIEAKAAKAISFVINIFTHTSAVIDILKKLTPGTLAAMLAVFYDVLSFLMKEEAAVQSGNIADVFSADTKALLAQIVTDSKTAESVIASDIAALKTLSVPVKAA